MRMEQTITDNMCTVFECAIQDGAAVDFKDQGNSIKHIFKGKIFNDLPTREWKK
jgi:hypothetical protein